MALAVHDSDDNDYAPSMDKDVVSIVLGCHQADAVKSDSTITSALAEITSSTSLLESTLFSIESGLQSTTSFLQKTVNDDKECDLCMEKLLFHPLKIENGLKSGFQSGFHTVFPVSIQPQSMH